MSTPEISPVGQIIDAYHVLGTEHDGHGRWVGADMEVVVHSVGHFFLNVLTKAQYQAENLQHALGDAERPQRLLEDPMEHKEPFVLNDTELSDEILERKFSQRQVEADLAESLWFVGPLLDD